MSDALSDRTRAMLERVAAEALHAVGDVGAQRVRAAALVALRHRALILHDDHDPRALHPARTIRILIADAGCRTTHALAAAAFVDSIDPAFAPDAALLEDAAARALLDHVPLPHLSDTGMLEALVTADEDAAVVALAERLDQARHFHQRPELPWRELHTSIRDDYIPAAHRLAPPLARRLERWADAFERRVLLRR